MRRSPPWLRSDRTPRGRAQVLLVASGPVRKERMESLVRSAVGSSTLLSFRWEPHPHPKVLERYAAVFVDGVESHEAALGAGEGSAVLARVMVLVDRCSASSPAVAARMARATVPVVVWGTPHDDAEARESVAALLMAAPAVAHLDPVLERICTPEQRDVIRTFLTRIGASTPKRMAGEVARSPRSQRRDCCGLGLVNPRALVRAVRVTRGLAWAHAYGGVPTHAAHVAGYADPGSWRRAVRRAFGTGPEELLAEWEDEEALAERYRAALLRG